MPMGGLASWIILVGTPQPRPQSKSYLKPIWQQPMDAMGGERYGAKDIFWALFHFGVIGLM